MDAGDAAEACFGRKNSRSLQWYCFAFELIGCLDGTTVDLRVFSEAFE